jgi:hypothetical protein
MTDERNLSGEDKSLHERVIEAAASAIQAALRRHKLAGNPVAAWRDGKVVIIPPEEIEA